MVTNTLLIFIVCLQPFDRPTMPPCRVWRHAGMTLILKYRAWEALTAGRGLLSWFEEQSAVRPKPRQWHHKQDRRDAMQTLTAGITKANTGIEGIVWNILGQTYVPKSLSESSF